MQEVRRNRDFTKEQSAGIRADHSAVKAGDDLPGSEVLKAEQVWDTVCLHHLAFLSRCNLLLTRQLYRSERPFHSRGMRNAG